MWIADNWKDYRVIDCSHGEKLEMWGEYLLIRPDPQVIWDTSKNNGLWKKPDGYYHRSSKGGGEWEFFRKKTDGQILPEQILPEHFMPGQILPEQILPEHFMLRQWDVSYTLPCNRKLTFNLKPFSFKHTGLFPEQAVNWDWFSELIIHAGRPVRVLNLFAYTGGATLAAAAAGAFVTHVDSSKGMVSWARENAAASGLSDAPIRWLVDDCVKFVEREIRRDNKYDAIIMDPPSYGRGPKGEIWKIEDSLHSFIKLCSELLSDKPLFFLINSYTTGLAPAVLTYMLSYEIKSKFGGHVISDEIGLPVEETALILPCGASGRYTS